MDETKAHQIWIEYVVSSLHFRHCQLQQCTSLTAFHLLSLHVFTGLNRGLNILTALLNPSWLEDELLYRLPTLIFLSFNPPKTQFLLFLYLTLRQPFYYFFHSFYLCVYVHTARLRYIFLFYCTLNSCWVSNTILYIKPTEVQLYRMYFSQWLLIRSTIVPLSFRRNYRNDSNFFFFLFFFSVYLWIDGNEKKKKVQSTDKKYYW